MRINLNPLICSDRNFIRCCAIMLVAWLLLPQVVVASDNSEVTGNPAAQQQTVTVTGVVADDSRSPLAGVSVFSAERSARTITDEQGRYRLTVPVGTMLTFSLTGYETRVLEAQQAALNVTMTPDAIEIDQIVMVGYGQQKKVTMTGSVASIKTDEIKQSSAANLAVALSGRLPGLTTLQTSGQPGRDDVTMYLRGIGTINGADPLIMIDGVPRSEISTLDPNEIESISILKDASATAVFGVRGANGVLLITTRRGQIGKPELSISYDQSWQAFTRRPDRIHSWEHAELRNQAMRNDGTVENNLPFTPWMLERYRSGDDQVFFPDRDLYGEVVRTWAPQSRVNINMNGGTQKIRYFMNVGYLHQGGNIKTEEKSVLSYDPSYKLDRYNFRANIDYNMTKRLTLFINLGSYLEKVNMPSMYHWLNETPESAYNNVVTTTLMALWGCPPGQPGPLTTEGYGAPAGEVIDRTGEYYGTLNLRGYHRATRTNLNSTAGLNYDLGFITEGLSTKFMISYDNQSISDFDTYRTHFNLYDFVLAREEGEVSFFTGKEVDASSALSMRKDYRAKSYFNMQYSLNYSRSFGKHDVSAMVLFQRDNWDQWGGDIPYNLMGLAGRLTYAYDYKYLAEFNAGYNGSEQFAKENRFGFFPAVSVGWVASNENFLKNNRVLTLLKFRATYGEVGNDKLGGSRFMYLDNYGLGGGYVPNLGRGQQVNQYYNGNAGLTWEKARKQNYGIDLSLFKNLSLTFDYFVENRSDILSKRSIPSLQGVPSGAQPSVNLAEVDNRGFEIEADYFKSFNPNLTIHVKGNVAYNKNVLVYNDEPVKPVTYAYRLRGEGYALGQQWGYMRDMSNGNGYINSMEELSWAEGAYNIGTPRLGDFKYVDVNNDGVIDDKDQVPLGYGSIPRITYGLSLTVNWKGLDFSVLFQGIGKASKYYAGSGVFDSEWEGFYSGYHMEAWTAERYANGETISYPALSSTAGVSRMPNDFFVMDRSFLRLKNIELGYTLPGHMLSSAGISRIRVYVGGQNVCTWDRLRFNSFDPEMNGGSSYPITAMINLGANLTF